MQYLVAAGRFGEHWRHRGDGGGLWLVGGLLWLLLVAAVVAGVVYLLLRASGRAPGRDGRAAGGSTPDVAVTELRLRYARGEVSRDDYLRTAADLGVSLPDDRPPAPSS
jgi:uncharacterized membrane protein